MTNHQAQSLPPDENAVVFAICNELTASGFEITQQLHTTERGIDVIAQHPQTKVKLLVEAKGGTSSKQDSERYGKPYTQTQVFDRVAKGIFTCLQLRTENPDKGAVRVILAIPDEPHHFKKYISTVSPSLDSAGIEVWFAKARGN
jgi:predicted nuclease with RNAse H fold